MTIGDIKDVITKLSAQELSAFGKWFAKFDSDAWDRQFEAVVKAGKLDALAERALQEKIEGRSSEL